LDSAHKMHNSKEEISNRLPVYSTHSFEGDSDDSTLISLSSIIHQLQQFHHQEIQSSNSMYELQQVKHENKQLKEEITHLEKQMKQTTQYFLTMNKYYEAIIQIIDRPCKISVFLEDAAKDSPSNRVYKNGNLEPVREMLN